MADNSGRLDVAIIGAGHNGLVAACYLARAGLSVTLFERRAIVGGAAVTEEFAPGFRNSTASYTVSLLHARIMRELRLAEHGLRIVPRLLQNFLPLPDGRCLRAPADPDALAREVARDSPRDAERLAGWQAQLGQMAQLLRSLALEIPPTSLRRWRELAPLLRLAVRLRALPGSVLRTLHELFTRSAGELLDYWFETDALKALYGFDAVVGSYASPYSPGSAYVLAHHAFGEALGRPGGWGHALGGMGSISEAIAAEARRLVVRVELEQPVEQVLVERGRACGLKLGGSRAVHARVIAANVDPRRLYLSLLEPQHLPQEFLEHIGRYRCGSASFRMNVALAELPRFVCANAGTGQEHLTAGIIIAPSLRYMDQAYAQARLHGYSQAPIIEMLIPSTVDDSLAPRGAHVASLFCQHFAPELPDARSWSRERDHAAALILEAIEPYAPNFRRSVIGCSALSPLDLEQRFGLTSGDIFHGALGLDQLWAARPVPGFGGYRSPVRGLYLCGAGAHPGGGVSGLPGYNAARRILQDWRALRH